MMKRVIQLTAVLTLGVLMGCSNSKVAYRSKATLSPAKEAGQYEVAFVIEDISNPDSPSVVISPRLTVLKGQEGRIFVGDDKSGIICTVLVDNSSGKPKATTSVSVKENGEVVWSENKTIAMSGH